MSKRQFIITDRKAFKAQLRSDEKLLDLCCELVEKRLDPQDISAHAVALSPHVAVQCDAGGDQWDLGSGPRHDQL